LLAKTWRAQNHSKQKLLVVAIGEIRINPERDVAVRLL